MYSSRHITHELGTHYTRICRLSTQCVAYLHDVSLSRFGECDDDCMEWYGFGILIPYHMVLLLLVVAASAAHGGYESSVL